ncbi:bifunctional DNA-formamidopyrimidine glycosylase/DNA-(apurinic or apyrimidinic site) lyase [Brevibacillus panacihumi]|uniref:Formamidopyrimidine-DNA glycosylase n=1 Tax=Brevibacillus panacihumi TaxID=497735 RepID=A0A3M8CFH8_9BACL|nr:bifunctional DNA-formamidopyrimidine glycosylase/DNA-(apurinic or apyrimidinic site) lyase [Brevibacillus panacihumi]RNB74458.1 bifunctional DNA-formamidopyrimidine glycosylase/DNA-(apurinic or apyrimidinic site) lyase [Brevibacillus panacihumi]
MPELPEMETYRKLLEERVGGMVITEARVEREKTINIPPEMFIQTVAGNRLKHVGRRGKHLLFELESGHALLLHLMLGGFLYWGSQTDKLERSAQVTLSLGPNILYFHGLRLGYLHLLTRDQAAERLADLGPEPLSPVFTLAQFAQLLSKKKSLLKTALVDQHWLAGIGNCYADEICFHAGILPTRQIPSLTPEETTRLYHAIQAILREAMQAGGYMEVPFYHGDRLTGGYNERCRVYDREGEPCPRCGHRIAKSMLSSRKVFACTNCQT